MTLLERVRQTITREQLLGADDRLIVGVSGGVDSVALASLLCRLQPAYRWTIVLGHIDHRLRDGAAETSLVQGLGARLGAQVLVESVDVPAAHRQQGGSIEELARRMRYEALVRMARSCHARAVAVAHTRDDQAETVLMRLVRGAGIAGTSGMPYARALEERRLVRPLLDCRRQELEAHVRSAALPTVEDPTNRDPQFFRNRIRHQLLPLLEQDYNPQIKELLIRWMAMSDAAYAFIEEEAARRFRRHARLGPQGVQLPLTMLRKWPVALQQEVVRQAIAAVKGDLRQLGFQHWEEIASLIADRPERSVVDLPGGVRAVKGEAYLVVAPALATVDFVAYNQPAAHP
ncbi:MAG: tRNA lysidine(34) synthetase TilS [Candidatus Omnitrophica bacterium]|nr:tRNA lysidine(34) synthetase TilS [Candidatus Omnitrophota bacterium]